MIHPIAPYSPLTGARSPVVVQPVVPLSAIGWRAIFDGVARLAVTTPTNLYPVNEASGALGDRIGTQTLTLSAGTATYRHGSYFGHPTLRLNDATTSFKAAGSSFMDGGTASDLSCLVVALVPTQTATNRALVGKRQASDGAGWLVQGVGNPATQANAFIDGGTPTANVAITATHHGDGVFHPYVFSAAWAGSGALDLLTDLGSDTDTFGSVTDITSTDPFGIGDHAGPTAGPEPNTEIALVACWDGYALTAAERQAIADYYTEPA